MKKQHWPGGAMLGPVPPALVSCGTVEKATAGNWENQSHICSSPTGISLCLINK